VEKYGGAGRAKDDNIIRCNQFACRMCKAQIQTNIYLFSTTTIVTRKRYRVTLINTLPLLLNFIELNFGF
jgi:hypothetical protein